MDRTRELHVLVSSCHDIKISTGQSIDSHDITSSASADADADADANTNANANANAHAHANAEHECEHARDTHASMPVLHHHHHFPPRSVASPFILRCGEILRQIDAFDQLLLSVFDGFVGYHHSGNKYDGATSPRQQTRSSAPALAAAETGPMDDAARAALNAEIAVFVAVVGAELRDMRAAAAAEAKAATSRPSSSSSAVAVAAAQSRTHAHEVQALVAARLSSLTQQCQDMHRERAQLSKFSSPFCFYGTDAGASTSADSPGSGSGFGSGHVMYSSDAVSLPVAPSPSSTPAQPDPVGEGLQAQAQAQGTTESLLQRMSKAGSKKAGTAASTGPGQTKKEALGDDFAGRYEGLIAPAAQLKQYESLASSHKSALLKEAKLMHVRYGEDLQNTRKLESSVNSVGNLMTEFANILASQSENLEEVHTEGTAATAHVTASAEELQLTIDRSESSANNIVLLSVGLAFLLLFLDFITP